MYGYSVYCKNWFFSGKYRANTRVCPYSDRIFYMKTVILLIYTGLCNKPLQQLFDIYADNPTKRTGLEPTPTSILR